MELFAAAGLWVFLIIGNGQVTVSPTFASADACRELRLAVEPDYAALGYKVTQCMARAEPA